MSEDLLGAICVWFFATFMFFVLLMMITSPSDGSDAPAIIKWRERWLKPRGILLLFFIWPIYLPLLGLYLLARCIFNALMYNNWGGRSALCKEREKNELDYEKVIRETKELLEE